MLRFSQFIDVLAGIVIGGCKSIRQIAATIDIY